MTGPGETPLGGDSVGLLEGICSTRAIRRYRDEAISSSVLRDILFAATRAPSGSNRQPFRFLVLTDGPHAAAARSLIGDSARKLWSDKADHDGYGRGSGTDTGPPKSRMAQVMHAYVETFESVPVIVLPCLVRYRSPCPTEGSSIYPACQNQLRAARALGYGGVMTGFQRLAEEELRRLLSIPDNTLIAGTITLGRPAGRHGAVRRRPMGELVFADEWGHSPDWAVDPPGTAHTAAGPPAPARPARSPAERQGGQ
jgi:nitroreductase